jgi:UDP-N-acetylglucosamine--N-acetylmuramyl-(pentapeptide) pyrophosphoryl-undecaprenol N-acetylglucosamine transferase
VLSGLLAAPPQVRAGLQVLHSAGPDAERCREAWHAAGVRAFTAPFVRDMAAAYGTADLAVSRAGAVTCAELLATGTPSVLVPYPHHADRQQFENARPLVEAGAALLVEEQDLTPERFRDTVLALLGDPARRAEMQEAAALAARGHASSGGAAEIADDLVRSFGEGRG